jgi:hypothetical protein
VFLNKIRIGNANFDIYVGDLKKGVMFLPLAKGEVRRG